MGPGTFSPLAVRIENGVRYIYVKRQPGEGAQGRRTVIIVGLPLSLASSEKLNSVLSSAGEVEKSAVHPSKTSAIVVFREVSGLKQLLKMAMGGNSLHCTDGNTPGNLGLSEWIANYKQQRPGNDILQKQIDKWMRAYEKEEERKQLEQKRNVESGGWKTIEAKGKKKTQVDPGYNFAGVSLATAEWKRKTVKNKTFNDLYRFQQKDRRLEGVLALRERFKEDKERIAEIRKARRFRPY